MNKTHSYRNEVPFYLWFILLIGVVTIALSIIEGMNNVSPPLTALGCVGATGPIYAYEESDLPECDEITRR